MTDKQTVDSVEKERPHKNSIWLTSFRSVHQSVQINVSDQDKLDIGFFSGGKGYVHGISRSDARLLAKRINQCLDATRKR